MKELAKTYDPKQIEERIYKKWEEGGFFHPEIDKDKKAFCIVMPPPNITGHLHMGHALDNTLQDILIRFKRMQGFSALWQPGTDHAAIATEVKIIEALAKEGISKEDMGRDAFLERAWEWKAEYGGRIINQLKKLGSSADWERERFTMDEGCSKAVEEVFISYYKKGLIYKGNRIINYCPVCGTSISDAEVEYEEQDGHMWHILYPVKGEEGRFVEVATTRPETMLGDTAVAVHPEDDRYKDLVGKTVILPIVGREIPVVADEYVDREFGTGVVKITPAHDPNDFEVGLRHDLPVINILNKDATINENGGEYQGLDRYDCREKIVARLKEEGLLKSIKNHSHNVGTHDRCNTTIEPMVMPQWFVSMKTLAEPAIKACESGELSFVPDRFKKTYLNWLYNIRDWCISRQLWWGHRIPAYECSSCGHIEVAPASKAPCKCEKCGGSVTQDPDTLDTWFSSALWPFSTLGWTDSTEALSYFYPTDVLVTGYDIIFFWVVRMVFSGLHFMGKPPFSKVFIHGLVRDEQGRKMSKSLGNGIDPLEVIDQYGADALRLTLVTGNSPGNDMRFSYKRVEASRNFANKVWNASRFILMNLTGEIKKPEESELQISDRWIISRINSLFKEVTENMDRYELGIAVGKVYDFVWDEFCDWYIEIVKTRIYAKETDPQSFNAAMYTLTRVLSDALKLLHPFMPFITEEIYLALHPEEDALMNKSWPEYKVSDVYGVEEEVMGRIMELVRGVRNLRSEMDVPPSRKATVIITSSIEGVRKAFLDNTDIYSGLCSASNVSVSAGAVEDTENSVSFVMQDAVVYLPLNELVDSQKERERLEKEKARLQGELKRSEAMLSNEKFLSKAPADKVKEEKDKLQKYKQMMEDVCERLSKM